MTLNLKYPLRNLLLAVTGGEITRSQMMELNSLCQGIALTFIRKRISTGKINSTLLGLKDRDIALDCVAELFSPGPEGRFVEFIDYFDNESVDIRDTSERLLVVHLRRLIFYVCNDNLFRMYGEADPSLSRIIRNLKLGLKRSASLGLATKFDEQLVVPRSCAPDLSLPVMPFKELQGMVDWAFDARAGIPDLLEHLAQALERQPSFRKVVPLTGLACCIREAYSRLNIREADITADPMFVADIRTVVRGACEFVSRRVGSKYLVKGKIAQKTLESYISGIRDLLESEFLGRTDGRMCYYDYFTHALPGISREEYTDSHRKIFEYLVKVARKRATQELREL